MKIKKIANQVYNYFITRLLVWALAFYIISHLRRQNLYSNILSVDVEAAELVNRYISWRTGVLQRLTFREMLSFTLSFVSSSDGFRPGRKN